VGGVDWLPTIASLTGLKISPTTQATLRGIDLSPILLQQRGTLRNYTARPSRSPLLNEWRFAVPGPCVNGAPRLAIRDNDLKLLINPPAADDNYSSRVELYHLPPFTDPLLLTQPPEFQNLAHDPTHAGDVQRLSQTLMTWYQTLPPGPHDAAPGCAGYRFPGLSPPPDAGRGDEDGLLDEAEWWG
jgi:arylsulfatase A-like enzyme